MKIKISFLALFYFFCIYISFNAYGNDSPKKIYDKNYLQNIKTIDLKTAELIALAENPSIQAFEYKIKQAGEIIYQAWSSYLPKINWNILDTMRVHLSENDYNNALFQARLISPMASIDDPQYIYKTQIVATWSLFDGFYRKFNYLKAEYGQKETILSKLELQRQILSLVATNYYRAQLALENLAIAKADSEFNQKQADDADARFQVGTGSLSDVLHFQVRVNSAKTEFIKTKENYEVLLSSLAALLGMPDASFPPTIELAKLDSETPDEMKLPELDKMILNAKKNRPDIKRFENLLMIADADIKIIEAKFWPTINLTATLTGEHKKNIHFGFDDFGNTALFNFSYNLYSGGYFNSQLQQAQLKKEESKKNLNQIMINVISEVRQSLTQLKSAQEQIVLQRENTSLVEQNMNLVEKEYIAGRASLMRFNEAQNNLITAKGLLALALVSLRQAWNNLFAVTGEILLSFKDL